MSLGITYQFLFVTSVLLAESDVVREGERIVKSGIIRLTAIRDIIDRASNLFYKLITQISKLKYNHSFCIQLAVKFTLCTTDHSKE